MITDCAREVGRGERRIIPFLADESDLKLLPFFRRPPTDPLSGGRGRAGADAEVMSLVGSPLAHPTE